MKKYLDPKNDLVFKKIFGEHPHLLISFLNALLKFEDGSIIVSIEYLPNELIPNTPLRRRSIIDVRCKDNNGRMFIVEMQVEWEKAFMQRMLYYTSRIYGSQIHVGDSFSRLQPVYGLAILNDIFDKNTYEYYHSFVMQNPENPDEKISGMNIVFIELPKFVPRNNEEKKLAVLWLRFLKEINEKTEIVSPDLIENREINEAIGICERAAYTEGEEMAYEEYWDIVSCEKTIAESKLEEGKEIGKELGKEIGKEEERRAIAHNLAADGFSAERIASLTNLSIDIVSEILEMSRNEKE